MSSGPITEPGASLEYVRRKYGVPAEVGGRVRIYDGSEGTILGHAPGAEHYLYVQVDGRSFESILHPTWKVEYLNGD